MFKLRVDPDLEEADYKCPHCGVDNWYYFDDYPSDLSRCCYCRQLIYPNPMLMTDKLSYRKAYHLRVTKKGQADGQEEKEVKIHSCGYSPY
jgi:hypothetical protein